MRKKATQPSKTKTKKTRAELVDMLQDIRSVPTVLSRSGLRLPKLGLHFRHALETNQRAFVEETLAYDEFSERKQQLLLKLASAEKGKPIAPDETYKFKNDGKAAKAVKKLADEMGVQSYLDETVDTVIKTVAIEQCGPDVEYIYSLVSWMIV